MYTFFTFIPGLKYTGVKTSNNSIKFFTIFWHDYFSQEHITAKCDRKKEEKALWPSTTYTEKKLGKWWVYISRPTVCIKLNVLLSTSGWE